MDQTKGMKKANSSSSLNFAISAFWQEKEQCIEEKIQTKNISGSIKAVGLEILTIAVH